MRITFDSNAYRKVVDPSQFPKDEHHAELSAIHTALRNGRIKGFLSETLATLEGVQNSQRGQYFAGFSQQKAVVSEEEANGKINLSISLQPNHAYHPGLHPIVQQWVNDAVNLGLRFMRAPRIGVPRPPELLNDVFEQEKDHERQVDRQNRFFDILRQIEARNVGFAVICSIGKNINVRLGSKGTWFSALGNPEDEQEENLIKKAVREWADADTVAAHYAYNNDYLCSEDLGRSAGTSSVFDASNRAWLESNYGVNFVTLSELASIISPLPGD